MKKTLVIVESPTKAKTIAKFLGNDFSVESSFGHVRDLPKSKMGVDIDGGTFEPQYAISREKTAQVKKLKDLAKQATTIIFATDEDREGEAIAWHLTHILGIDPKKAERMVFHEITKTAIDEALKHPRHIDQRLVDAQQARRVLDRLVGYELSPLLWKKVARGLSAGRVQSVAVRLIVEREREIKAFIPKEFWTIHGLFQNARASLPQPLKSVLHSLDEKKIQKFDFGSKESVTPIVDDIQKTPYAVEKIEKKETKRTPPPPFTTSTLQQSANQKLGYSSKQTMVLAQQLYEGIPLGSEGSVGLITYMRTDSVNLSQKFLQECTAFLENRYGPTYALTQPRVYKTKSKGAQEAHEAIRPTDPARTPEAIKNYLDPRQLKLYTLIWKRAVATQMAEARLNKTNVHISGKGMLHTYTFRANGQSMTFDGWLALYPQAIKEEMLPDVTEKEAMTLETLNSEQSFTEPPARYSDATLVKALEEQGIGRPSTYAPTIATIEARNYVERDDDKRLSPTDIALVVNDLLVEHFSDIVDYGFTAQMEENLDDIAEGKKDWQPIIATFYHPFHKNIEEKTDQLSKENVVGAKDLGVDPESGKKISVRVGRYGPFVQKGTKDDDKKPTFASLPKNVRIDDVTLSQALTWLRLPRVLGTDNEGHAIIANVGRFGPYVQVEKKYYSLKDDDPYTIDLVRANEIIAEKKEAEAKAIIKTFNDTNIVVRQGRYGPYITDGATNAKIPKTTDPSSLDEASCRELLEEAAKKPKGRGRARTKKTAK